MRWSLVLAGICGLAVAAEPNQLAPEIATLSRIKNRMVQTLARQPNYTCVQQVERSHRRLPRGRFELHDLLRIEVALVEGKEMYAWPGSRKFEDVDLTKMVQGGAIGSGNFATHARAVFGTSVPRYRHIGPDTLNGRETVRYDYVVAMFSSGYRIQVKDREAIVGYHGSFWADSQNHDLVRLEIVADDIPPSLGLVSAHDTMEYARVKIGTSEFLLPRSSELVMTDIWGNESRNRTVFTNCRQYTGESVLTFDEAPPDDPPADIEAAPVKAEIELPAGLFFDVKLQTVIDSATAAVGDPVTAVLTADIRIKQQILAPKGAKLSGRILRLERRGDITTLDLQFDELENAKLHATLSASLDRVEEFRRRRFRLRAGERIRLRTSGVVAETSYRLTTYN